MPSSRANNLKSSDASCDTRVFSSASALPVCESKPEDRDQRTPSERASDSLRFWLSRIAEDAVLLHRSHAAEISLRMGLGDGPPKAA